MKHFHEKSMTVLHDRLCNNLLYSSLDAEDPLFRPDYITGTDTVFEHVYAEADRMEWDYDLKRVWVPSSRWTMMVRQYVDREELERWLDLIKKRGDKKAAQRFIFRTNTVKARTGGKSTVRNLGSCMLTLSFALQPEPIITLHSRTCYMGYLSPLDMSIAYHLGRLAAEQQGLNIRDFRFVWFIETAQFHQFRTIAYALGRDSTRQRFLNASVSDQTVALKRSRKHYDKWSVQDASGVLYEDMQKFVSYQRLRKRFHTEVMGYEYAAQFGSETNKPFRPLLSTPVRELTIWDRFKDD